MWDGFHSLISYLLVHSVGMALLTTLLAGNCIILLSAHTRRRSFFSFVVACLCQKVTYIWRFLLHVCTELCFWSCWWNEHFKYNYFELCISLIFCCVDMQAFLTSLLVFNPLFYCISSFLAVSFLHEYQKGTSPVVFRSRSMRRAQRVRVQVDQSLVCLSATILPSIINLEVW